MKVTAFVGEIFDSAGKNGRKKDNKKDGLFNAFSLGKEFKYFFHVWEGSYMFINVTQIPDI
jgi:hypothetical protein